MQNISLNVQSGWRRIENLRLVENTGRVLNLIALENTLPRDEVVSPNASSRVAHRRHTEPFFFNELLNRAIFVKHNVRAEETRLFDSFRPVETKVLIPFDSTKLELGGRSFFIGELKYREVLCSFLRLQPDAQDQRTKRDLKTLELFRSIPSFDPFILSEALRVAGIQVDRRYFVASYEEMKNAAEAVYSDVKPLIETALGKKASNEELERFVDQVWNLTETSTTNLFFETLRIPSSEWHEIVFAWKALLYYRLKMQKTDKHISNIITAMKTVRLSNNINMCATRELRHLKYSLVDGLFRLQKRALATSDTLSRALVNAISSDVQTLTLRDILRKLSKSIVALGTDVTVFEQASSYYMYLFGDKNCYADGTLYEATLRSLHEIVALRFADKGCTSAVT